MCTVVTKVLVGIEQLYKSLYQVLYQVPNNPHQWSQVQTYLRLNVTMIQAVPSPVLLRDHTPHVLPTKSFFKNYQEVLTKIYFDAGLSDLARASGYLPRSIGTNFKRTHRFLLESWEALYRVLMRYFLSTTAPSDFLQRVSALLQNFPPSANQENANRNLKEMIDTIKEII